MLSESKGQDNLTSSSSQPPPSSPSWWTGLVEQTQKKAAELAAQSLLLAEQAGKAAQEKATLLAEKAQEIRQNYDMELATNIIMTSIGAPTMSDSHLGVRSPCGNGNGTGTQSNSTNGNVSMGKLLPNNTLDLVYVTENVIAMAFPFDPKKPGNTEGGNDIFAVSKFLQKRHSGHFMVWNVSEEPYDYSLFADQVLEYKFPGHPAPPLGLLFKICTAVESWLDADDKNVAIIHCLTGKGRTAALIACILTWIGEFSSPIEALQYISDRKGIAVDFLTIPSQRRYVQYFSNMLDGVKPRSEPLLLRRVIINSIPIFGDNGGGDENLGCCPYVQLFKCGRLIATAAPPLTSDTTISSSSPEDNQNTQTVLSTGQVKQKMQLKWVKSSEGSVSFVIDCVVQGDILLRCRHADASGARVSMFRSAFHTGYVPCGVLRLTKNQLDGSCSDPRFDDDFFVDLIFAPIEKVSTPSSSFSSTTPPNLSQAATQSVSSSNIAAPGSGSSSNFSAQNVMIGVPNDAGVAMDSNSADKYETTLHRDTRFWDAVAARKSKGKKRRQRKFMTNNQDQFSISDETREDICGEGFPKAAPSKRVSATHTSISPPVGHTPKGELSDSELIMQLARAEENSQGGQEVVKSGIDNTVTSNAMANVELQALDDLEKELGLELPKDEEGHNVSSTLCAPATLSPTLQNEGEVHSAKKSPTLDTDDLDELERYLQALASK